MKTRKEMSMSRTIGVFLTMMVSFGAVLDIPMAVLACPGPSPNPQPITSSAAATATCAAKVQQQQQKQQQHLSTPASASVSNNNNVVVEPFGVPKDKTSPAFKTKSASSASASSPTSTSSTQASIRLRGGALVETSTSDEVDDIVQEASVNELLVVIDFTASWCGPCKAIAPLYKEMSEEYDTVIFLKVDVDEDPDTAAKYSVSAMPTFLFVKGGKVIDRLQGANPQKLRDMVEEYL
mmetsp:Transcript_55279/g.134268  ORF Transcript_55279/g.134268 Transcript_55279/m.134268 type:complete len:237 (-) Transcript_55279:330-1040(-)|eukprot:CAMPEP_0113475980 /NCGR_PEP_ID=MMETSP0014_2-20120614/19414_1 /TAXON_ID=2857 /ORGANISM="Nitzschia sp." /LENGTH=236 /DNA_ID=CAMNT_0000368945 /DNA_START=448 /DNA_END=1158 /DNA_ORIENTATION=+ /assembly_acc=CAM_ASM_000159